MSSEEQQAGAAPPQEGDQPSAPSDAQQNDKEESSETDRPQTAWAALRDLTDHIPRTIGLGDASQIEGGIFGGTNHGIAGGTFSGDFHFAQEINYQLGRSVGVYASGEIAPSRLEDLSRFFVPGAADFDELVARLAREHVLVLAGPHFTGRRTAALMLLQRLGVHPVRAVSRDTTAKGLTGYLEEHDGPGGHVLCDLVTERGRPLREADVLAARSKLGENGYLVITVGPSALLEDVPVVPWQAPDPIDVLRAHLGALVGEDTTTEMLVLPSVTAFLERSHQPREAAAFAQVVAAYAVGAADSERLADFSLGALENQVQEWFEDDGSVVHLREKAFLVALAAFDAGPYALTAELGDLLYSFLQKTEDSLLSTRVPVFGTHIGKRLQLARAERYEEEEPTEWGPVGQVKARFLDERAPLVLLREIWTGHPSARPALIQWLRRLSDDGRPFVRTRAASTAAVLAHTDLPSAMALVIEPWAASRRYRHRGVAVNALTLTHFLGTPNVPRILDAWCAGETSSLVWVAIRAHGLIGSERPAETLAALRAAARRQGEQDEPDEHLGAQLAESVELLLLSAAADQVFTELTRTLNDDRAATDLALGGFLNACCRTEKDKARGQPLLLNRYAQALTAGTPSAEAVVTLWRAALNDRGYTRRALDILGEWVLAADHDPATEWALAALLPSLATTTTEQQRLNHLLRTMPGEDGAALPAAAGRLLTVLPRV
ncbi:hypothetical protein [Streptomyces sp. NPDC060198]|uniref:hypothetical protein n=1 Tax=Streptomyces sp. NPDC060198 TaxID=3347070 RepID=UPI0036654579